MISGRTKNGLCAGLVLWVLSATLAFAQNVVQRENAKPGTPGWQLASPADWPAIEGYASATSVNRGETISFHVSSYTPNYQITIYRMGWYGGAGARQVSTVSLSNGVKRAVPSPDPVTGIIECDWPVSHQVTIPNTTDKTDWASGIYLAKLTPSGGDDSFIIFVVRDDSSQATYLYQSTATTSQAYNYWGGKSLYAFNSDNAPARKVSFNRPYGHVNGMGGAGNFFEWEVNFVRFVEREGYDVTYASNIDLHVNPNLLVGHKAFLTAGHDEYWSYQMRAAVQAAQARGVHLGFFAANEAYWQVRFEPSSTGQPNRTMVAYKEAAQTSDPYAIDLDKTNDKYITARFRDLLPDLRRRRPDRPARERLRRRSVPRRSVLGRHGRLGRVELGVQRHRRRQRDPLERLARLRDRRHRQQRVFAGDAAEDRRLARRLGRLPHGDLHDGDRLSWSSQRGRCSGISVSTASAITSRSRPPSKRRETYSPASRSRPVLPPPGSDPVVDASPARTSSSLGRRPRPASPARRSTGRRRPPAPSPCSPPPGSAPPTWTAAGSRNRLTTIR